jgi:hypothetical protein
VDSLFWFGKESVALYLLIQLLQVLQQHLQQQQPPLLQPLQQQQLPLLQPLQQSLQQLVQVLSGSWLLDCFPLSLDQA